MLFEDIQKGSEKYHREHRTYVEIYDNYFASRADPSRWRDESTLDADEVNALMTFLRGFGWRTSPSYHDKLSHWLRETLSYTNHLCDKTLLDVQFDEPIAIGNRQLSVEQIMKHSFDTISKCPRVGSTFASKILHAINPDLFVMWDYKISVIDGVINRMDNRDVGTANHYVDHFLTPMQRLAKCSISQIMDIGNVPRADAVSSLIPCSHSLPKVLDEYNFVIMQELVACLSGND